jgi:hypothetical protein
MARAGRVTWSCGLGAGGGRCRRWQGWSPAATARRAARRRLVVVLRLLQPGWHLHGAGSVEEIEVVHAGAVPARTSL